MGWLPSNFRFFSWKTYTPTFSSVKFGVLIVGDGATQLHNSTN